MINTSKHSMSSDPGMTIGVLAKVAEVNIETIRFYQRKGLMPEPLRLSGGIRRYAEADRARLHFIKTAQRLGFSLGEISELLQLDDGTSCVQARTKAEIKLTDVQSKLMELRQMEAALVGLIRQCGAAKGRVRCPLIAALKGDTGR